MMVKLSRKVEVREEEREVRRLFCSSRKARWQRRDNLWNVHFDARELYLG